MTELKFRPLASTIRRQRYDNWVQAAQERRQAFQEAWGSASDVNARTKQEILEILVEDPRWTNGTTPRRVTQFGHKMRQDGWHLPDRSRGLRARAAAGDNAPGLPAPPKGKNLEIRECLRYADPPDLIGFDARQLASYDRAPISSAGRTKNGGRSKRKPILLTLLESGPKTTQDILLTEKLDISRPTLLKDLRKLESDGLVVGSTLNYKGKGRAYQWTSVHIL